MTMRKMMMMMIRVARLQDRRKRNRKTNEKNVDDSYKSSKRLHSNTKQEENDIEKIDDDENEKREETR